jgi:hypothetical protein
MSTTSARLTAAAIGCGLAFALAGGALAQQAGAPPTPPDAAGRHAWGDPAQMKARMEERRQHRMQVMHDALGLRADQEGAWQSFLADSKTAWQGRTDRRRGPDGRGGPGGAEERSKLTTPERLDRMSQRMAQLQARLAQRAATVKRFYAALDARQQKTFDALFSLGRGRFGHGFGRDGFGEGRGPG